MKKILVLLASVALGLTGCPAKVDYSHRVRLDITNNTGVNIIVVDGLSEDVQETILPQETKTTYDAMLLGGKNYTPASSEAFVLYGLSMRIKINDEFLSETVWKRKYWNYGAGIYKLVVTDELIESIGYETEINKEPVIL